MSTLLERTVREFLLDLSAPTPTPGGGSAAAAAAAMGASLLAMVAGLPRTRTGDPEERAPLQEAHDGLAGLRDRLAALIEQDARSYDAVTAAFRLPKATDEEKSRRTAAIQQALRGATDVPLEVMRACDAAAGHALAVARFGNASAASDAGVGFELLRAGLRGAAMNVRINLEASKDAAFADVVREEAARLEAALESRVSEARQALA